MAIGKTNAQRKVLLTTPDAVTPTKSQQIITTPDGYDGMDQVIIETIPSNYIDTSDATAVAAEILQGETAYVNGKKITGTMAVATQATPSISVSSSGLITASATQTAGYVASGTKSATKQLTAQAAKTFTPTTSDQTISSGRYLTGTQTIKGDANLLAENIAKNVTIFGVTGTYSGSLNTKFGSFTYGWGGSFPTISGIERSPQFICVTPETFNTTALGCYVACDRLYADKIEYMSAYNSTSTMYYEGGYNWYSWDSSTQVLTLKIPTGWYMAGTSYNYAVLY